ncbi:hypothetical protein [Streptomyces europaeiscabiei]|nr:hypothetical protein OHB30_49930 [Streptomyces europaeiscabiei]
MAGEQSRPVQGPAVRGDRPAHGRGPLPQAAVAVLDERDDEDTCFPTEHSLKARKLADHFATGSRAANASTHAFFDPAGQDLLANLLAAACGKIPITQIYTWLSNPKDDTPERILRGSGRTMAADGLNGVLTAPDKQRSGIYDVAQEGRRNPATVSHPRWSNDRMCTTGIP